MSKYVYRLHRDVWLDVEVEADDEASADDAFEEELFNCSLNDRWRDGILEAESEIAEVWEGGIGNGVCIYSIY